MELGDFGRLQHIVREHEPLGRYTWLGVGGPARWFSEPTDRQELVELLRLAKELNLPTKVLGGGSNVMVRDEGFPGLVISLAAPAFCQIEVAGQRLLVGTGAKLGHVISISVREGLAGLESLVGVPGTLGGGLRTNCSAHGTSLGELVESVRGLSRDGEQVDLARGDLHFGYRHSNLDGLVLLSAVLALEKGDAAEITRRMQKLWIVRRAAQPSGETGHVKLFQDPQGELASKLIELAGQKTARHGKAVLYGPDPNFVVLEPGARSADVLALMETIREAVARQLGVDLHPQLQIW